MNLRGDESWGPLGPAGDPLPAPGPAARRGYLLVPVALGLLLIPAATANVLLGAALAITVAVSIARRAAARRARPAAAAPDPHSITLGADTAGRPARLSERQLGAHGLIVGASGAGKSTTLLQILTAQVGRGRPVIAIDMKGSPAFAEQLAAAAAAAGRPFRVWTPDGPGHWNPLQHGNATELKDKLISSERFTEPHYQRAAERYVQTVLQVLHDAHPDRAPTLDEVVELMDPLRLAAALRPMSGPRVARVQDYLAGLTPDQLSAVRGLGTRLAIISESHTGRFLAPGAGPEIDLRRALDGREVVLFSLNSSVYGRLSAQLGALAIQDLVAATGDRLTRTRSGLAAPPAIVAIDEFSALGADNVLALLARGRESGVSVLLATQELADLERAGHGFRDQVLGVTAVKVIHRQDVPASAQLVAQMAGTQTVWEQSYQIGRGPLGAYSTSGGTRRPVERFVVHPNEIKTLPTGRVVLITKTPVTTVRVVDVHRRGPEPPPAGACAPAPPPEPGGPDRSPAGVRGPDRSPAEPRGPDRSPAGVRGPDRSPAEPRRPDRSPPGSRSPDRGARGFEIG